MQTYIEFLSKHTVLLHDLQELDNDFRAGADENLTLAALLSIVNCLKSVTEHTDAHHFTTRRQKVSKYAQNLD